MLAITRIPNSVTVPMNWRNLLNEPPGQTSIMLDNYCLPCMVQVRPRRQLAASLAAKCAIEFSLSDRTVLLGIEKLRLRFGQLRLSLAKCRRVRSTRTYLVPGDPEVFGCRLDLPLRRVQFVLCAIQFAQPFFDIDAYLAFGMPDVFLRL